MDTDGTSPSPRRRRAAKTAEAGSRPAADRTPKATGPSSPDAGQVTREGLNLPEAALASLDLQRGAIGRLDAQEVSVTQGAIGAARAESIHLEMGALGAAMANQVRVSQAGVGTVLAGEARLEQTAVRTLMARDVVVERPSLVGFLFARRVSGDVRVLFDWRGAVVFGVVFGLLARLGRARR